MECLYLSVNSFNLGVDCLDLCIVKLIYLVYLFVQYVNLLINGILFLIEEVYLFFDKVNLLLLVGNLDGRLPEAAQAENSGALKRHQNETAGMAPAL